MSFVNVNKLEVETWLSAGSEVAMTKPIGTSPSSRLVLDGQKGETWLSAGSEVAMT